MSEKGIIEKKKPKGHSKKLSHKLLRYAFMPLAILPLPILYGFADICSFFVGTVFGYRRKVVRKNLEESFPDLSSKELKKIERNFYRHFCDQVFESLKLLHISEKEIKKRMRFENIEIIDRALAEGKQVVIYFSHCGNWEWATSMPLHSKYKTDERVKFGEVYRPLKNKAFDTLMKGLRTRFKSNLYPKATVFRSLLKNRNDGYLSVTAFMSDQKPSHGDPTRAGMFLNHPTAMITGTETLARKMGVTVVYWDMNKTSRGHYTVVTIPMADNASQTKPGELTDRYRELLEGTILRQPEIWLWSHKRWKHPVIITTDQEKDPTEKPVQY